MTTNGGARERDALAIALGKVIVEQRIAAGLSQEGLAEKAGVHVTYISQLERGKKSPTVRVLTDLAKAMGIRAAELLRRTDEEMLNPTSFTVKPRVKRRE